MPVRLTRTRDGWVAHLAWAVDRDQFTVHAPTQASAKQELTELVAAALGRDAQRPVLVIGGDEQYASCLHLIWPDPGGWSVHVIRDGRLAAVWSGDGDRDHQLAAVLRHAGGTPAVVHLP